MKLTSKPVLSGKSGKRLIVCSFALLVAPFFASSRSISAPSSSPAGQASTCSEDAQAYWSKFRAAVLRKDMKAIVAVTRFPFSLRGQTDNDGERKIDKKMFLKMFSTMLAVDPGDSLTPSTMSSMVESNPKLPSSACAYEQARIGQWEFLRTRKGWRFVRAYLDELP